MLPLLSSRRQSFEQFRTKVKRLSSLIILMLLFAFILIGTFWTASAYNCTANDESNITSPFGPMTLHKFQNCTFSIQYPADYQIINTSQYPLYQNFPNCQKYEHFMAAAPGTSIRDITKMFVPWIWLLSRDCGEEISSTPSTGGYPRNTEVLFYCEASCSKDVPIQANYDYMMDLQSLQNVQFHREQILTKQGIPVWVIERAIFSDMLEKILFYYDINKSRYFEAHFRVNGGWEGQEPEEAESTYESLVPLIDYMFSTFRVSGACPSGQVICSGICTDITSDVKNCGRCGNLCHIGEICKHGKCVCPSNQTNCSGYCSDIMKDVMNCGECGNICSNGSTCEEGECECPSGEVDCNGNCTDINKFVKDVKNCGGCGNRCPNGATCKSGKCVCPSGQKCACPQGLTNCSGYCRNISNDVNNCGKCGFVCGNALGAYCSKGSCLQ
jgi:hypothetical protein